MANSHLNWVRIGVPFVEFKAKNWVRLEKVAFGEERSSKKSNQMVLLIKTNKYIDENR
jgi:hypothetical protein